MSTVRHFAAPSGPVRAVAALVSVWIAASPIEAAADSGPERELRVAHEALWNELASDARQAAARLGPPPADDAQQARSFRTLDALATERGGRLTFHLVDPYGDIVVWGGAGLLHDVKSRRPRGSPCGFTESSASVSLWCAEPLVGPGVAGWSVLAGESFGKERRPPVAASERGRFRAAKWRIVQDEGAPTPRLECEGLTVRGAGFDAKKALRLLAGAAALICIGFALARRGRGLERIAPLALGAGALALGASPASAVAVALAAALAFAADRTLRDGFETGANRRAQLAVAFAAAVGPLLLLAPIAFGAELGHDGTQPLFGSATVAVLRFATTLFALAAIGFGAGALGVERGGAPLWLAGSFAAAVGAAATGSIALAAVLLAAAGLAAAVGCERLGSRRPRARVAAWVAAALVAGAAATATGALRERRTAPELVARLLPPSRISMEGRIALFEHAIEAVATQTLAETPPLSLPPSDLAYAIWRKSPLARSDARSSLAVGRPGFAPSIFAFGLPVDDAGRLDPAPVRWVELDPSPWRAREIAGELDVDGPDDTRWRLSWTLVPRPGFSDPPPSLGDLASGLLGGGTARGALTDLPAGARSALYDERGAPLLAPWGERTPELDPAWLSADADSQGVRTPEGRSRVVAARGEGVHAAIFLPTGRWSTVLERLGSFAAANLLVAAALGAVALLVALGPRGGAAALRRSTRSYSQRLLLVFSALVLVPSVLLYALLASALERRLEREQESRAREALRSAQRVLGEYVLSLDPGFGVDTALDDRLLEWLARVVRHEVNLYWGSEIYASSKRELFTSGLSPGRIPGEIWERVALSGESFARRTASAGRRDYLELYAPLEVPGEEGRQSQLVLALPLLAQQEELDREIAVVRRRVLLGTLALFGLLAASGAALAASFARPIQELVGGTRRIAEGATALGFRPGERELESLAEAIDQMAEKVAEGRSRLLAEKGLVERIVENVTAAVVGLDREGRVLLANRFARERLGAAPGEPLVESLERAGLERLGAAYRSARPGVEAVATESPGPAGRDWTLVRVPLGGGEPAELVVVEDVTDVSRAQRLEAWAAMARIIAHEIKNPLTPIRLSAEHLREAWTRDRQHFESVFEHCTANILVQVEELRRTASEFSLYAEIPRSEKQRGELGEIVREVVDGYRQTPPPGVEIRYRPPARPLEAEVDRRLVGRAVRNLIENALRAQADGGEVEVEVGGENGFGFVRVADRGPGVSAELLGRILEPYFSTQAGGTGLGLPIARRVAAEHGGELTVRNRAGGGFEVTITIPVA